MQIYIAYLQQTLRFPSYFRQLEIKNVLHQPTMMADNI